MSVRRSRKKSPVADWHRADVIAALHKRGTSLRKLALERGCNGRTFTEALRHPYPKAEAIIAAVIGVSPRRIWPSRYDPRTPTGARRLAKLHLITGLKGRNVKPIDTEAHRESDQRQAA
jgi:Ner family transcriptional regulator